MERHSTVRSRSIRRHEEPVTSRLAAIRTYMRSIHAACLESEGPQEGHVLLIELQTAPTGVLAGGYTLVAQVGADALLSPIQLSRRGELECGDRLIRVPYAVLSTGMIVGWETMILPERSRDSSLRSE